MTQQTSNPVALITGGSRGIGLAIAGQLKRLGYRIAISGRNPDHLKEAVAKFGDPVHACKGDVSNPDDVTCIVEDVSATLGPIDVLVNNAGISGLGGPFLNADPMDWWDVQEVNLRGPMLFMRAVLPGMVERGQGTVINIGSYAAIKPLPGNAAYCVSKAALARLTDSVALELDGTGVSCFCLSPGLVLTDMTRDVSVFKDLPQDAWSKPEDVCRLIQQILENDCSALNGRFLHVHDDFADVLNQAQKVTDNGLYRLRMDNLQGRID